MYPILFKIGGFSFYTHGFATVLGIILASAFCYLIAKKAKLSTEYLFDNIMYSIFFGIIGARLTYFFLYQDQFNNWREIFFLWQGGMVSYGGFFAGAIALVMIYRYQKQPVARWLDVFSIAFPIGLFMGRIGNILAGEYSGFSTESLINLGGRIPIPLFEALLLLGIFALLLFGRSRLAKISGLSTALLILLYGTGRLVIDFWRDEVNYLGTLSLGQIVSLVLVLFSIILIIVINKNKENNVNG